MPGFASNFSTQKGIRWAISLLPLCRKPMLRWYDWAPPFFSSLQKGVLMEAHVHLPEHLAAHATLEAERLRLSLDDLILVAVHDFTERPSDRRTRLLAKIAA